MAAAPHFPAATARAQNGTVRVELASAPVAWNFGFVYSISPAVARALAAELIVAADAADKTSNAEKSTAASSGD